MPKNMTKREKAFINDLLGVLKKYDVRVQKDPIASDVLLNFIGKKIDLTDFDIMNTLYWTFN